MFNGKLIRWYLGYSYGFNSFGDLVGSHFQVSTLSSLPPHMRSLADENPNMPSMSEFSIPLITNPKLIQRRSNGTEQINRSFLSS
jgi:hypothetical protein